MLQTAVQTASAKSAQDIVVLDVREVSLLADYFMICSGRNNRQIQAIVNDIIESEQKAQVEVKSVEGKDSAKWILIDLGDVIVHVFTQDEREFYQLEKLWADAPFVDISTWVTE
ncbi:ribosome silencing factor [Tetragenococcus halophilus]|uniref:ribosome silencing factor n=1 Tax=Tetragenococcus halophilus TaxID=51669 RepID=UPI000CCBD8F0|nr:ribosome silencing factor [Tetragenococcus halophilus]MCF1600809.1 ribosome silencing factor [Tetragenococcus halophilus]MCF1676433.1 ribosome silencing factor [Tetragenococcus halophilus]MCO8284822.1 ribosome silencing factor [Tetragenococcus halophilus]MCO8286236.1 ribosome silencing factor [Tetragenococcus halophilus]MCO8290406.1 ribosome silencing factor [Tetragenococcus halophilus]